MCIFTRQEQSPEPSDIRVGGASGGILAVTSAVSGGVGAAAGASTNEGGNSGGLGDFGDILNSTPYKSNMFTIGATATRDDPQRCVNVNL